MNEKARLYPSQAERRHSRSLKAKRIATRGENLAAQFLTEQGYTVLARNYRAGRAGEIDIIASDNEGVLAFVEVKTRTIFEEIYGIPELGFEAVSYKKQRKILLVSRSYLAKSVNKNIRWRYDVIVIGVARDEHSAPEITHVVDAFN